MNEKKVKRIAIDQLTIRQRSSRVTAEINNVFNGINFLVKNSGSREKTLRTRLLQIQRMVQRLERRWTFSLILLFASIQISLHGEDLVAAEKGKSIVLTNAVYGIPLKASPDNVLLWCKDNQIKMWNPTKDAIKKHIARILSSNEKAKALLTNVKEEENLYLSSLEKEIVKMRQGDLTSNLIDKELNRRTVEEVQKYLDILKAPTFDYNNNSHYLFQQFDGIKIYLSDKELLCRDARIADTTYAMVFEPSGKLDDKDLECVGVSFYKDETGKLWSYAVNVVYAADENNQEIRASFKKKYTAIAEALDAKYGSHKLAVDDEQNWWISTVQNLIGGKDPMPCTNWGSTPDRTGIYVWGIGSKWSIFMVPSLEFLGRIYLSYMDDTYSPKVHKLHEEALGEFIDKSKEKNQKDEEKLKSNF